MSISAPSETYTRATCTRRARNNAHEQQTPPSSLILRKKTMFIGTHYMIGKRFYFLLDTQNETGSSFIKNSTDLVLVVQSTQ